MRCACTGYCSLPNGECANCGAHDGTEHSGREVRNVMFIVQELAAAGELFGILMHCGPFEEDYARFYFRQLIAGGNRAAATPAAQRKRGGSRPRRPPQAWSTSTTTA
jgi:hypothetical protein